MQFVELQLELTDELRVRLLQLLHSERQDPLESRLPAILNTASYISEALAEWGTSPVSLMLDKAKPSVYPDVGQKYYKKNIKIREIIIKDFCVRVLKFLVY